MPFRMQPMCRLTRRLAEVVLPPSTPPCPRRHPSRHAPPRTRRRSSCCTPAATACDSRRWRGMAPRGARAAADPDAAVGRSCARRRSGFRLAERRRTCTIRRILSKFRNTSLFLLLSALRSVQTLVKMLVFVIFLNVVLYATLPTYQPKHPRWYLPRYQPSSPPDPRHVKL